VRRKGHRGGGRTTGWAGRTGRPGSAGRPVGRRAFLRLAGAATAGGALVACSPGDAGSGARPIRLGYVSPQSGPFVSFGEADGFVLDGVRERLHDGLKVGRRSYPVEIVLKDSQSDPGRAATVAGDLLRRERIDLMLTSSTPETTNPVADVCERAGVPCISTFTPWQSHFFGRKGDPGKPFQWTYHFYWGLEDVIAVFTDMWDAVATNKVVGALWPDDPDGYAWSNDQRGFPPELEKRGYRVVDPGRYRGDGDDYGPLIRKLRAAGVEIITGVPTPPDFATFWKQAGVGDGADRDRLDRRDRPGGPGLRLGPPGGGEDRHRAGHAPARRGRHVPQPGPALAVAGRPPAGADRRPGAGRARPQGP
jgi:branched-chain amino acid transport system substrate-binding protein